MILLKRSERGTPIPFGPYLAAAGWITLLQGENLMRYYFSFFGL
jgi:leader peptidase (prepilin peptidase)/N-methyltransferase